MKKVFVILAMLAALALASEVVTIPLLANSNSVVESTSVENVGGGDNAVLAAVLSCIIPGLGQVYLGKVVRGLVIFGGLIAISVVSTILGAILSSSSASLASIVSCVFSLISLGVYLWQIYDAYTLGGGNASASDDSDDEEEDDDDTFIPLVRPVSQFNF